METVWDYLKGKGYTVVPRGEKKCVHLVLEQEKLNPTQKSRMGLRGITMEKLDGVYSIITVVPYSPVSGDIFYEVRHWGRSGKALQNTNGLDKTLLTALYDVRIIGATMFSSEITSDDPLAKLSGYLTPARVNDTDFTPTNMRDNLFDMISLRSFINGKDITPYKRRLENLKDLMGDTKVERIPYLYTSFGNAYRLAKSYWQEGKEGVVHSQLDSMWIAGAKNETRIKFKEKLSFECTVIGMASGKKGTKYETMMGKLIVAFCAFGIPEEPQWIEVPISGVTDVQRKLWWEQPELILAKTVKVDAKSYTETGNLREPRYKETREDKGSDFPVCIIGDLQESYKNQCTYKMLPWEAVVLSPQI